MESKNPFADIRVGMGASYRSTDTGFSCGFAIDVLPAALEQNPERVGRSEASAKIGYRKVRLTKPRRRIWLTMLVLAICLPESATANVGLPTIFGIGPLMLVALLPVVGVEAFVLSRWLGISAFEALKVSGIENVISTLIGVPLAWFASFFYPLLGTLIPEGKRSEVSTSTTGERIAMAFRYAAWLPPFEGWTDAAWLTWATLLLLLVPCFILSLVIESMVARGILSSIDAGLVNGAVFWGNALTYGLLSVGLGWITAAEWRRSRISEAERIAEAKRVHAVAVAFTAAGDRLIAMTDDGVIRAWDADSGRLLESIRFADPEPRIEIAAISSTGNCFAWVHETEILVGSWSGPTVIGKYGLEGAVSVICLTPDGRPIAAAYDVVKIFSPDNPEGRQVGPVTEEGGVCHAALSFNGDHFAAADGVHVHVSEVADGHPLVSLYDEPNGVLLSPDRNLLITFGGYSGPGVRAWDIHAGLRMRTFGGTDAAVVACTFVGAVGNRLATLDSAGRVSIWDFESGTLLSETIASTKVDALTASADGSALALASDTVSRWAIGPDGQFGSFQMLAEQDGPSN